MSLFAGKTLMITGGTGSFGNAVLNRFLDTDVGEIRIFSRDEKKQDDMRHRYQATHPETASKIKFYIGDVRNLESVRFATRGVDYIFHAAASTIFSTRRRSSRCRPASFSRWRRCKPTSSGPTTY